MWLLKEVTPEKRTVGFASYISSRDNYDMLYYIQMLVRKLYGGKHYEQVEGDPQICG